uniref:Uncharacterized protein n=1 Tax=Oryza rufipogon TaxID=4529 RepID=A0A0E0Q1Q0_ORYRU
MAYVYLDTMRGIERQPSFRHLTNGDKDEGDIQRFEDNLSNIRTAEATRDGNRVPYRHFDKPPRATLPTEICTDKSGQEAASCCHDIPRGPKNPRRKKAARASSASSFLSRSRSSSFVTACGDFSELRGGLRVA